MVRLTGEILPGPRDTAHFAGMDTVDVHTTTNERGQFVDVDNSGRAQAPPVLLLHGWTGSKEDFTQIVYPLSRDRRVIAPDLPGHGTCPPAVGSDYSLGAHVKWVVRLLDDLGIGDVHLLGHSHGGLIAQRLAYLQAQRIASLTLVGCGLGAVGQTTRAVIEEVATTARDDGMQAAWARVEQGHRIDQTHQASVAESTVDHARREFQRDRFLGMSAEAVVGVARNLITATPLGAFTYGIDFPVLVCHGQGDTSWLPREQRLLAKRIPGSTYAVISAAQHSPMVDNPVGMLQVLQPFITALDVSS